MSMHIATAAAPIGAVPSSFGHHYQVSFAASSAPSAGGSIALPVAGPITVAGGPTPPPLTSIQPLTHVPLPPPPRLCRDSDSLPDPETIKAQKEQYAQELEEQLRHGVELLGQSHKQQTEALHANANQEKHRYNLVLDQQVKQQELLLSQQYNEQLMRLQQAAQAQRAGLEKQACGLILEYQQRKVQEEFMAQQSGIQKQHQEAQQRLAEEMQKLSMSRGTSMASEATSVVAALPAMPLASYPAPAGGAAFAPVPAGGGMLQYVPPGVSSRPASRSSTPVPIAMSARPGGGSLSAPPGPSVVMRPAFVFGGAPSAA